MSVLDSVHADYVHGRRVRTLAGHLTALIPEGANRVVDVGCGDGLLAALIKHQRPELDIQGVDVLVRPDTPIQVQVFDGRTLPYEARSVDVVMLVDVLHHTEDPLVLLKEAARVARRAVVLKDHLCQGWLARPTLRFMDWVGNARHGVALPYNYQTPRQWALHFSRAGLAVAQESRRLGLYPFWADWVFGRSLHTLMRLEPVSESVNPLERVLH